MLRSSSAGYGGAAFLIDGYKNMCPIAGAYKRGYGKSCGALGWWCLDCLLPCPWNRVPPVIATRLPAEERAITPIWGGEKAFFPLRTPGVVKNLK